MAFCAAVCDNKKCSINWRLRDKRDYYKWSEAFKDGKGPINFTDFSGNCNEFKKPKGK